MPNAYGNVNDRIGARYRMKTIPWVHGTAHTKRYHDAPYAFGFARPDNRQCSRAAMDVSPAPNGFLAFNELSGDRDRVAWRFVDAGRVPGRPWMKQATT